MDLDLTAEQRELDDLANRMLADRAPLSLARSYLEGHGDHDALWAQLRAAGWYEVGRGDDPFGTPGLACLARATGRFVAPTSLVDTVVAHRLLADGSGLTPGVERSIPRLEDGATVALGVVTVQDDDTDIHPESTHASLRPSGDGHLLIGTARHVVHGATVDLLGLLVRADGGARALVLLPATTPGLRLEPEDAIDPSMAPVSVLCQDVRVKPEQVVPVAAEDLMGALDLGAVLSAAEAVGAAQRGLEMSVEYAHSRHQFGRAIGSFQALQHLMATAYVRSEAAWSTVLNAAAALDEAIPEGHRSVSIAKAYVARGTREVIHTTLQVLGGIAFTWEHDAHLLQRRVLAANERYGSGRDHEARLTEDLRARIGAADHA